MAEYMKTSFASNFFAVDMMFMLASSIKGKSTLLLRDAARRFIFRSAIVCGRSISRWLKAEKVRYAEKELSNKRRLLLKICGFHKFRFFVLSDFPINGNLTFSFMPINKQQNKHNKPYPPCNQTTNS